MLSDIPLKLLTIENDGFHLMITASVNGNLINMLIDTGASRTVFDLGTLQGILKFDNAQLEKNQKLSTGIGTNTLESVVFKIPEFVLGKHRIKQYDAVLIDLSLVNQTYMSLGFPRIDGILGGDLLIKFKAVIDYRNFNLRLGGRRRRISAGLKVLSPPLSA